MIEFKVFFYHFQIYLNNTGMVWIRIRMYLELLPGSGTQKIQRRIRNKTFRIRNTNITVHKTIQYES